MLGEWSKDKTKPFYLNVSHIATHTPWQAPADVTAKYMDVYSKGWDVIRAERFERQKTLGLVSPESELPPRNYDVPAWDSLSVEDKAIETKKMAVYAAMIEILDNNVGKLVDYLKEIDEYNNTAIVTFSDNGAAYAFSAFNQAPREKYIKSNFDLSPENMGNATSYGGASKGWAMASNTPYNRYKGDTFDGGVHTAAFIHYPQSKAVGLTNECIHSVMDIAPTFLEMAGITYPDTFNDKPNAPMEGVSMANIFAGDTTCDSERWLGWELNGAKGVRKGDWKLSQLFDSDIARLDTNWYLFNMKDDPFESIDLSQTEPKKFKEMAAVYQEYAKKSQVVELYYKEIITDLKSVTTDGVSASTALLTGGVSVNYNRHTGTATAKQFGDNIEIDGVIRPEKKHQGLPAEILVVASHTAPESDPVYFTIAGNKVNSWDGTLAGIPAFKGGVAELPSMLPVEIFDGPLLPVVAGDFSIWFGYRLQDGTVVRVENPINLTITD
jgi:arylsulfatase